MRVRDQLCHWRPERKVVMVCRSQKRTNKTARSKASITQLMRVPQTSFCQERSTVGTDLKEKDYGYIPTEQVPQQTAPLQGIDNAWPNQMYKTEVSTINTLEYRKTQFADTEKFSEKLGQHISYSGTHNATGLNTFQQTNNTLPGNILSDLCLGAEEECFTGAATLVQQTTAKVNKSSATQDFTDLNLGAQEECYAMMPMSQTEDSQSLNKCETSRESNCSIQDETAQSANQDASQNHRKMLEKHSETLDKSAQRLFRKRMLVLYHWLQPGVTNSQLNSVLAKTWDSLPSEEKEYYLSQGIGQPANLKTNPQLHTITELPEPKTNITEDEAAVHALLETFSETGGDMISNVPTEHKHKSPQSLKYITSKNKKKTRQHKPDSTLLANSRSTNNLGTAMCNEDMWDLNLTDSYLKNDSDIFWEDVPTIKELFHMTEYTKFD